MDLEIDRVVDWLELDKDTIELIISRLTVLVDFIRFGAVCKTWRSIFLQNRHRLPQLPVLIIPSDEDENTEFRSFFSFSEKQTYRYRINQLPHEDNSKCCCGSSEGHLIMIDRRLNMSILNPFSGAETPLPLLTMLSRIIAVRETDTGTIKYIHQRHHNPQVETTEYSCREKFVHKAITAGPYIVAIFAYRIVLAFCRRDDETWTDVESNLSHFQDILFYKGNFYVVTIFGCVAILDLSGPHRTVTMVDMNGERDFVYCRKYLVESSGQLLLVMRTFVHLMGIRFQIFRVDVSNHKLIPLKALGDVMLFVGENHSISVSARDFTGFEGNRIYFIETDGKFYPQGELKGHNIVVYDIVENWRIKEHCKMDSKWLWSRSTWLTPKP